MKLSLSILLLLTSCKGAPLPSAEDAEPKIGHHDVEPGDDAAALSASSAPSSQDWSLHFSPNGGCETAIVTFIGTARRSVHLMAYGFTSEAIAGALVAKKSQSSPGAEIVVEVVLDRSDKTAKGSMAYALQTGNVKVWIDSKHPIMHDKVIVVDDLFFENGSYNFTKNAEHSNAENCLIEKSPEKAKLFAENWQLHQSHSVLLSNE
jgi:phosphatidylserine/phosphatidylglycerophosphate/cardiolipin synthase-like enzyme